MIWFIYNLLRVCMGFCAGVFIVRVAQHIRDQRLDEEGCFAPELTRLDTGEIWQVTGVEATIGRSGACSVYIDDPQRRISRFQARVSRSSQRGQPVWEITNIGRVRLEINQQPLAMGDSQLLKTGDLLRLRNSAELRYTAPDPNTPPVPQPFNYARRRNEAELFGWCALFLLCGLLATDIGLRLDITDGPKAAWDWLGLWLLCVLHWSLWWLGMTAADTIQYRRQYQMSPYAISRYANQAILPLVAFLLAVAAIAGYRGEAVPLSPQHAQLVWQELAQGDRMWNAAEQRYLPRSGYHEACLSLIERTAALADYPAGTLPLDPAADQRTPEQVQSSAEGTYSRICDALKQGVRMASGDTRSILQIGLMTVMLCGILPHILAGMYLAQSTQARRLRQRIADVLGHSQSAVLGYGRRLFLRGWLFPLIGPAVLIGVTVGLMLLEQLGLATRRGGQLVSIAALGQHSEFIRLFLLGFIITMVQLTLTNRLRGVQLFAGLGGTAAALLIYYLVTRDLGPLLISALVTSGLLLLTLSRYMLRSAVLVVLFLFSATLLNLTSWSEQVNQSSYSQVQQWLERPSKRYTEQEYIAFCEEHQALCEGDATLRQAQYAAAAGGIPGVGPGRSVTIPPLGAPSWVYISSIHSDYIFVQILEEYGSLGGVLLVAIFFVLSISALRLSQWIKSEAWRVTAAATGLWWSVQVVVLLGGNLRMLPLIGIPLPFVSYGKTAMVVNSIVLGLQLIATTRERLDGNLVQQRRRQLAFVVARWAVTFGYIGLIGWFSVGMYVVDRFVFDETVILSHASLGSKELKTLVQDQHMGPRASCAVQGRPRHDIISVDDVLLLEITPAFYGCSRTEENQTNAQLVGMDRVIRDILIDNPELDRHLAADEVRLTVDYRLQRDVLALLTDGFGDLVGHPWGQALVMDREGRIVALVDATDSNRDRQTTLSLGLYVPGSVMKVVTAFAALEAGVRPTDEIDCYAGRTIDSRPRPVENSLQETNCQYAGQTTNLAYALAYSVNTFFAGLTDAAIYDTWPTETRLPLTRENFIKAAAAFGFEPISQDDANKPRRAPYWNYSLPMIASSIGATPTGLEQFNMMNGTWADTAYGQGTTQTTLVQMGAMMQIIANNGQAMTPRLMDTADVHNKAWEGQRISEQRAEELQELLYQSVTIAAQYPAPGAPLAGAAQVVRDNRQIVAGKSGTAEIEQKPPISWFAGFINESDASYIIVVMVSEDHLGASQHCSAAAIAGTIADRLLNTVGPSSCRERDR